MPKALHTTHITSLPLLHKGKGRDIYDIDDDHMLIVTTDRISAFDVVMPTAIPGKGEVLNEVTRFWMEKLAAVIPNHLSDMPLEQALPDAAERAEVERHATVVRKLKALPVEAVVRGYLIGPRSSTRPQPRPAWALTTKTSIMRRPKRYWAPISLRGCAKSACGCTRKLPNTRWNVVSSLPIPSSNSGSMTPAP